MRSFKTIILEFSGEMFIGLLNFVSVKFTVLLTFACAENATY